MIEGDGRICEGTKGNGKWDSSIRQSDKPSDVSFSNWTERAEILRVSGALGRSHLCTREMYKQNEVEDGCPAPVCVAARMYVWRQNIRLYACARIYTRLWTNHGVRSLGVYPSTKATLDETLSWRVAASAVIFKQISSSLLSDSYFVQSAKFNLSLFFPS